MDNGARSCPEQDSPPSTRGEQRVARILKAATELFLKDGYDKTPVDAIVERSGGSKATLYSYFPTKAELFRAVVENIVSQHTRASELDTDQDIDTALMHFGVKRLGIVLSPRHQSLLRLVISERDRFPDLADMYTQIGPNTSERALISYLAKLKDSRRLDVDDPEEAAGFLIGMMLHRWYTQRLLFLSEAPSKSQITRRVRSAVSRFLTIYPPIRPDSA